MQAAEQQTTKHRKEQSSGPQSRKETEQQAPGSRTRTWAREVSWRMHAAESDDTWRSRAQ